MNAAAAYSAFCVLRDARKHGAEAPTYTEAQAFDLALQQPGTSHTSADTDGLPGWPEYAQISNLPDVDAALRGFNEDPTADNATCVVRAVLEAARPADAHGRTNEADETGGTVRRFGFDCTKAPPDIIPATNGAYVWYRDYLKLFREQKVVAVGTAPLPPFAWINLASVKREKLTDYAEMITMEAASVKFGHCTMPIYPGDSAAASGAANLPGWERGIATVTLTGHQLHQALEFINPDGDADPDQLEDELTFGIVQHKDDDGKASIGLCCWNGDTDGVLPLFDGSSSDTEGGNCD
jgi:hypothetical protein